MFKIMFNNKNSILALFVFSLLVLVLGIGVPLVLAALVPLQGQNGAPVVNLMQGASLTTYGAGYFGGWPSGYADLSKVKLNVSNSTGDAEICLNGVCSTTLGSGGGESLWTATDPASYIWRGTNAANSVKISDSGNQIAVGNQIITSGYGLTSPSTANSGAGVYGYNNYANGKGVYGANQNSTGYGVFGYNTDTGNNSWAGYFLGNMSIKNTNSPSNAKLCLNDNGDGTKCITSWSDVGIGTSYHSICANQQCYMVSGPGTNACSTNADCGATRSGYRMIFVTSAIGTGNLGSWTTAGNLGGATGLDAGDRICNNLASAHPELGGGWKAWLSSDSIDARAHLYGPLDASGDNLRAQEIRLIDGATKVADSFVGVGRALTGVSLSSPLYHSINIDDNGAQYTSSTGQVTYTGTTESGQRVVGSTCNSWTSSSSLASEIRGNFYMSTIAWTNDLTYGCSVPFHIYCLNGY